jgi:nitrite reductase/ring-hydroxylating ferredoxin subunit/Fe-S cluster biogenesis protein NfuA
MSTAVSEAVTTPSFEELAQRVDKAVAALAQLDPEAREVAEELKNAIEAIHREGLVTIVRRMRADDAARPVLFDLVDDPVVHLLLSLHGIIRPDPMTEAARALQAVRPQLHEHGGDVTLVRIEDGTAFVRLHGACNGCSMSSVTLRTLVETALVDNVSTITAVEVLPADPEPTLIAPESLFAHRRGDGDGWVRAGRAADVPNGGLVAVSVTAPTSGRELGVLVVNVADQLTAYVNECAHEALPLDGAVLDVDNGTLTCPWHGFCYDAGSGECLSAPGAQLEQLPLRVEGDEIWVRVAP